MIEIDDKIIATEVVTARFCCDVALCKGECCVEGNSGAPIELSEAEEYEQHYEDYKRYLTPEGVEVIGSEGFAVVDYDGDLTTPLINGAQCAYCTIEGDLTWCAIERAYRRGECSVNKPISCHLYPIRLTSLKNGVTGLQYHRWGICRSAEIKGAQCGKRVFENVKEAIIRRFGSDFYAQLEEVADYIDKEDELHTQ